MDKIHTIFDMLERGIPFSLSRFNDGEMTGIGHPGSVVARGDQMVLPDLTQKLIEAIQHEQENYWVGMPCSVCWPMHSMIASALVRADYPYLTKAVVLTNRNWELFISRISGLVERYNHVAWIGGSLQHVDKLPFHVHSTYSVPMQDAWSKYQLLRNRPLTPGSLTFMSCGPLSRVLAKEWFERCPEATFIDIGSTFDPFTKDLWLNCHKWADTENGRRNAVRPCPECN